MALVFWRIGTVPMNLPTGALLISQIANVVILRALALFLRIFWASVL